jgi:hypothetical protein
MQVEGMVEYEVYGSTENKGKASRKKKRKKWAIFVFLTRAKNGNLLSVCLFRFRQQQATVYGSMGRVHRNKREKMCSEKIFMYVFSFVIVIFQI